MAAAKSPPFLFVDRLPIALGGVEPPSQLANSESTDRAIPAGDKWENKTHSHLRRPIWRGWVLRTSQVHEWSVFLKPMTIRNDREDHQGITYGFTHWQVISPRPSGQSVELCFVETNGHLICSREWRRKRSTFLSGGILLWRHRFLKDTKSVRLWEEVEDRRSERRTDYLL